MNTPGEKLASAFSDCVVRSAREMGCKYIDYLENGLHLHFDGYELFLLAGTPTEIKESLANVREQELKTKRELNKP